MMKEKENALSSTTISSDEIAVRHMSSHMRIGRPIDKASEAATNE